MRRRTSALVRFLEYPSPTMRKLLANAGRLATGNMFASLIGMLTFVLTARHLTLAEFGALSLISSYVAVIEKLVSFQSWQVLIAKGAELVDKRQDKLLVALTRYCIRLEFLSMVCGTIIGVSGAYLLSGWIDWIGQYRNWVVIYSLILLIRLTGVSSGLHRLFGAFSRQAYLTVLGALIRLSLVGLAIWLGGEFAFFFIAWLIGEALNGLILLTSAFTIFMQRPGRDIAASEREDTMDYPKLLRFMWSTSIEGSIRTLRGVDMTIVGSMVGTEAAALYAIARRAAGVVTMFVDTSFQSIYPELSRMAAQDRKEGFRDIMVSSSRLFGLITALSFLGFAIFGTWIIERFLGVRYVDAYGVTLIALIGPIIWGMSHVYWPALLALGEARLIAKGQILVTIFYLSIIPILVSAADIQGAAIAYSLMQLILGAWLRWAYG